MGAFKVLYHLGLGDAIVCQPIISKLSKEHGIVRIPCWQHNLKSVTDIFSECPNVDIYPFKSEYEMIHWGTDADLKLGYYSGKDRPQGDFISWFYAQSDMDLRERNSHCLIRRRFVSTTISRSNFIHDDKKRGFCIKPEYNPLKKEALQTNSILDYCKEILEAKEVHCIDSSFLHLSDCLNPNGKLHYHKYARPGSEEYTSLRNNWNVIK